MDSHWNFKWVIAIRCYQNVDAICYLSVPIVLDSVIESMPISKNACKKVSKIGKEQEYVYSFEWEIL